MTTLTITYQGLLSESDISQELVLLKAHLARKGATEITTQVTP
jgi:hypothetical protein